MRGSGFPLRLTGYERIAKDLKPTCIRLTLGATEGIDVGANANVDETTVLNHLLPGCTRQTTGNSGGPQIDVGDRRGGYRFAVGNVGELQIAAALQHTRYFREDLALVGTEIDDPVGNDHIGPAVLNG